MAAARTRTPQASSVATYCVIASAAALQVSSVPARAEDFATTTTTAQKVVELKDFAKPSLCPSGPWGVVAITRPNLVDNRVTVEWMKIDLRQTRAIPLGSAGDAIWDEAGNVIIDPPSWAPDCRAIFFRKLVADRVEVWRTDLATGVSQPVVADAADILSFTLTPAGDRMDYQVGATRAEILSAEENLERTGRIIDESVTPGWPLFRSFPVNGRIATVRRDKVRIATLLSDAPIRTQSIALSKAGTLEASGMSVRQTDEATSALTMTTLRVIERGMPVYDGSPLRQVVVTKNDRETACPDPKCQGFFLSEPHVVLGGTAVAFVAQSPTLTSDLVVWKIRTGKAQIVRHLDGLLGAGPGGDKHSARSCAWTDTSAICAIATPMAPPELQQIDLRTGIVRVLAAPNAELERLFADVATARLLSWTDADGVSQHGSLVTPKARMASPPPLVVTSYRCAGFARGGNGGEISQIALAKAGIATLCVEKGPRTFDVEKGSTSGQPSFLGVMQRLLAGVVSGIDYIARRGEADSDRVGINGLSLGGHLVGYAISRSDRFKAASSAVTGYIDPTGYFDNALSAASGTRANYIASYQLRSPDEDFASWAKVSPALAAARIRAPLLVQAAESEWLSGREMITRMADARRPMETIVYPLEAHNKMQPIHRLSVIERNTDWFRFWLLGAEDDDLAKAAQYRRWRALRALANDGDKAITDR